MIRRHFGSALTWMPLRTSSQHRFIHVPRRADLTFVMRDMMKMDGEEGGHYRNLLPPIPTKTASSSSSSSTSADGDEKMWSSVLNALMAKGDGGALSEHTPTPQDAYRAMLPKAQDPSSTYLSSAGSTSSWPWELPSLQYAAREFASSSSSSSTTSAASLRAWARSSRCVIRALRKTSPELQSALLPGLHDGSTLGVACIGECVRAAIAAEEGGEGRLGCSVEATPASSSSSSSSSTSTAADAATARSKENAGAGEALFWEACNATGGCGGASSEKNKTSSSSPSSSSSSSSAASTKEDGTATTPTPPTHTPLEVFYLSGTVRWPSSLLTACGDELATPRVLLVLAKHVGRTEEWGLFAISTHLSTEDVQRMAGCGATDLHDGPQTSTLHVNHDARVVELRRCAAHLVSRPGEATMDLLRQLTKDAMMEDVEDAQACAEVAYQAAFAHCQRHVCGEESIHDGHRSLARAGLRGNDVMMAHPVIRKRVLMMKAYAEGGRALLVELNRLADAEMYAASEEMRQLAALDRRWLLPITHVALTKWGRDALTACKTLMMDGDDDDDEAHGVKKMRMEVEQHERLVLNHHAAHRALNTSRVAEDLLTESLATNDGGLQLQRFAQPINQLTRALLISWSASGEQGRQLWLLQKEWKLATARLRAAVMAEPKVVADFGEDYVLLTAQLSLGFYWLRMAEVARRKLAASSSSSSSSLLLDAEQKVWRSKVEVCDYVFTDVLPQTAVQLKVLQAAPLSRQTNTSHWMPS